MKRIEAARKAYEHNSRRPTRRKLAAAAGAFFDRGETTSPVAIRSATVDDIARLVRVDRRSYGRKYGADRDYLREKIESGNAHVLVVESKGKLTGFAVLDLIKAGEIPSDYANLNPNIPPQDSWVQISSFTTKSNYFKAKEDQQLVEAIEKFGNDNGYYSFGTCLSLIKDHPYPAAYKFWEDNGYNNVGTIQWQGTGTVTAQEPVNCNLYLKQNRNK
jgi:hypothetical protein